jgi:hypothetical protein
MNCVYRYCGSCAWDREDLALLTTFRKSSSQSDCGILLLPSGVVIQQVVGIPGFGSRSDSQGISDRKHAFLVLHLSLQTSMSAELYTQLTESSEFLLAKLLPWGGGIVRSSSSSGMTSMDSVVAPTIDTGLEPRGTSSKSINRQIISNEYEGSIPQYFSW